MLQNEDKHNLEGKDQDVLRLHITEGQNVQTPATVKSFICYKTHKTKNFNDVITIKGLEKVKAMWLCEMFWRAADSVEGGPKYFCLMYYELISNIFCMISSLHATHHIRLRMQLAK